MAAVDQQVDGADCQQRLRDGQQQGPLDVGKEWCAEKDEQNVEEWDKVEDLSQNGWYAHYTLIHLK